MILEYMLEQGSVEWLKARRGLVTCSKFGTLFGTVAEKNRYLKELREEPVPFNSAPTAWGKAHEKQALSQYQIATGIDVVSAGMLARSDFPMVAGSPDGVILADGVTDQRDFGGFENVGLISWGKKPFVGGVEIKCPYDPAVHLEYCDKGLPHRYFWQVQGYIWLTGADWWDFCSYDPRQLEGSLFYCRVSRDESAMVALTKAIDEFCHVYKCRTWFANPSARSVLLSGELSEFLKK